jgi:hypothetical protein
MTRILTIIALLFATPAWAGEITILCKDEYFNDLYRYNEALFGKDIVEVRVDGRWEAWAATEPSFNNDSWRITSILVDVRDFGAVKTQEFIRIEGHDNFPKGTTVKQTEIIDFTLLTLKETYSFSNGFEQDDYLISCKKR